MLELEQVAYSYGQGGAGLQSVSLRVGEAELVAIAGANGVGKSTLLRTMARVLSPVSGRILFEGKDLREWNGREYARKVGYLPQELDPVFPMKAIDVVLSGRFPFMDRFEWEGDADFRIAGNALRLCDAEHLAERRLHEMSGGEKKRVLLARVLAGEPRLILLDEPLTALDLGHAEQFTRLLREIVNRSGKSVVFVSHDLNWSASCADRMLVLSEGRIAVDGRPADVMRPEVMREYFGFSGRAILGDGPDDGPWIVPTSRR